MFKTQILGYFCAIAVSSVAFSANLNGSRADIEKEIKHVEVLEDQSSAINEKLKDACFDVTMDIAKYNELINENSLVCADAVKRVAETKAAVENAMQNLKIAKGNLSAGQGALAGARKALLDFAVTLNKGKADLIEDKADLVSDRLKVEKRIFDLDKDNGLIDRKQDELDAVNNPAGKCVVTGVSETGIPTYKYASDECKNKALVLAKELAELNDDLALNRKQLGEINQSIVSIDNLLASWGNQEKQKAEKARLELEIRKASEKNGELIEAVSLATRKLGGGAFGGRNGNEFLGYYLPRDSAREMFRIATVKFVALRASGSCAETIKVPAACRK